jgi:hypothetical protein
VRSEVETVKGVVSLLAAATAAVGRQPVAVVVRAGITEAVTETTEVAAAESGVGKSAAAAILEVLDGKGTSAFPL